MYNSIISASLIGIKAQLVKVEVDMGNGIPIFDMTGFLTTQVKEAGVRVKTAMKNSGFLMPPAKITVNISPANIRKTGTGFDLPIAFGILANMGILEADALKNTLVIGEMSLDGSIRGVRGILPVILEGKKNGIKRFVISSDNYEEAKIVSDIIIIKADNLKEVIKELSKEQEVNIYTDKSVENNEYDMDYMDVKACKYAKRASMVAAAGFHNIVYIGAPGVGKTMLAKRLPTIISPLSYEEKLEVLSIYSVAGSEEIKNIDVLTRPFRSPHHTISFAGLIGGGPYPVPGEISLANKGILFLDELTEFSARNLDMLRQPLEDKEIVLSRNYGKIQYPADFMLVGAMNPCKCGYYPDRNKCKCSENEIKRFIGKISNAFMDRVDIMACVSENKEDCEEYNSKTMREKVRDAVLIQQKRYKNEKIQYNSSLSASEIKKFCHFEEGAEKLLENYLNKMHLEMRRAHKIIKVARTIGDLEGSDLIKKKHISEAISYRI